MSDRPSLAALALKDVAIYERPTRRVCLYVRARIWFHDRNAAAWRWYHTASPRALQVPPPQSWRAVHLCAGIVMVGRMARWPRSESAQPYNYWAWPSARHPSTVYVDPGPSLKGFSTHMEMLRNKWATAPRTLHRHSIIEMETCSFICYYKYCFTYYQYYFPS